MKTTVPLPGNKAPPASRRYRTIHWRDVALWAVLALFLPVAFAGLVSHANEYRSWGGSGVDCDGPFLLAFAVPAAVVYGLGGLVFIRRVLRRRRRSAGIAALACVLLVFGLLRNINAANRELNDPGYRLVCGDE